MTEQRLSGHDPAASLDSLEAVAVFLAESPHIFGLLFAALLVIAGVGLLWNVGADLQTDSDANMHQFNWETTMFLFVWAAALTAVVTRRHIFAALAAGIALYISLFHVSNVLSMAQINACRASNQHDSTESVQRCTAGGILAYAGMFLSLMVSFMPYAYTPVIRYDALLALVSIVLVVVGCVVLWTSSSADTPQGGPFTLVVDGPTIYTMTLDISMIALMATFYTFSGMLSSNLTLRSFAVFVSAYAFNWIFHDMFDVLGSNETQVYAGCVLCWLGMICNIAIGTSFFWEYQDTGVVTRPYT